MRDTSIPLFLIEWKNKFPLRPIGPIMLSQGRALIPSRTRRTGRKPMVNQDDQTIRPETLLEFSDPQYLDPSPTELRTLLSRANLTGAKAGYLVGVNGRTIRKWTGGERAIPYAAWRLLLKETGEVPQPSGSATRRWVRNRSDHHEPICLGGTAAIPGISYLRVT